MDTPFRRPPRPLGPTVSHAHRVGHGRTGSPRCPIGWKSATAKHQPHEDPRPAVAVGGRLDDPLEAEALEHRRHPDVAERDVDAAAVRVDRVGLDAGCARPAGVVDDALEQRRGDTLAPVADADVEAENRTRPARRRPSGSSSSARAVAAAAAARTRTSPRPRRRRRRASRPAAPRRAVHAVPRAARPACSCRSRPPGHAAPGTSSPCRRCRRGSSRRRPSGRPSPARLR